MKTWQTDHLIDDVARAMTSGARDVNLRSAVLARIEPRASWRALWLAVPVAAAALVVVSVVRRAPDARVDPGLVPSAMAQASPVTREMAPAAPPPVAVNRAVRPAAMSEFRVRTIPVLAEPTALPDALIQPNALAIPLLSVKPIATEPLAMIAIDDGSGGRQPRF